MVVRDDVSIGSVDDAGTEPLLGRAGDADLHDARKNGLRNDRGLVVGDLARRRSWWINELHRTSTAVVADALVHREGTDTGAEQRSDEPCERHAKHRATMLVAMRLFPEWGRLGRQRHFSRFLSGPRGV